MAKKFLEVFNGFGKETFPYLTEAEVEDVRISRQRGIVAIHLFFREATVFLEPTEIKRLEEALYHHLNLPDIQFIRIKERYQPKIGLPLETIYQQYSPMMYQMMSVKNPLLAKILEKADCQVSGQQLIYAVERNEYDYLQGQQTMKAIEKLFEQKFGLTIECQLERRDKSVYDEYVSRRDSVAEDYAKSKSAELNQQKIEKKQKTKKEWKSDGPVIGNKAITGDRLKINELKNDNKYYNIEADLVGKVEYQELRSGKYLGRCCVTDYSEPIMVKFFIDDRLQKLAVEAALKKTVALRLRGKLSQTKYDKDIQFMAQTIEVLDESVGTYRQDNETVKRIELHAHTNMSEMDAVVSPKALLKQAVKWGHSAIAITDNQIVQGFPEAYKMSKELPIQVIYGMEIALVDDLRPICYYQKGQDFSDCYVVFDIETTGLIGNIDKMTEIGAVKIKNGKIIDEFAEYVNPERPIPKKIQELTGIDNEMVKNAPVIDDVLPQFLAFCEDAVLVAQNADFDISFIKYEAARLGKTVEFTYLDTLEIARHLLPDSKNYRLDTLSAALDVQLTRHHRAIYDARATAGILLKMFERLRESGYNNLADLSQFAKDYPVNYKKMRPTTAVVLVTTQKGMFHLYQLVSESHIKTFFRVPRILKSRLIALREGLIVGASGGDNDFYQSVLEGRADELIERVGSFYDYFELHPMPVARVFTSLSKIPDNQSIEKAHRRLCHLADIWHKPVVATGDLRFLNPEDERYRHILKAGKKLRNPDAAQPFYFRTTSEMLADFDYLGREKAVELVVTNPQRLVEGIGDVTPIEPGKFPPKIDGAAEELRQLCYDKAKSIYGQVLPGVVEERLERELHSIISNHFAVMYIIAQKLVKKSNEDGYLVGSRGSVGSSLVATMSGITEVNPLPPHYVCPACHYTDFDSETVRAIAGNVGIDLPDRECPECGQSLNKSGFDIPFETFLGFKGNKEPDIDLNFSGDYQNRAHEYTEELFGSGNVFRAGTIGKLADKTAYGFVANYFEEREIRVSDADIKVAIEGCVGVKRTTGQHPGGIIVLPKEEEIYRFTPIQKPANDQKSKIITTHFDYHSIDHNLLKLDILGHDDPTMIRFLEDMTGVDAKMIPLDEPKVMSLFTSLEALDIRQEAIGGISLGSLGVPEFGTDFVIQMLLDTKPTTFSDLVRISGLSHGTDVWINNGQELVQQKVANLSSIISTRDDIMTYLIYQGLDKELSFTIMESVRKGKGLKPEWEVKMTEAEVPQWYIESCKKIQYMFPKAHAVAYVMMAYRIAYFKVYYPKEYYAAYYSIRASNFDYEVMCQGKARLDEIEREYQLQANELSPKEQGLLKEMRIVREMYARGIDFCRIDLYRAEVKYFQLVDGRIMPNFMSIQGMGEKAAESIVKARQNGPFISIEDFMRRTSVSKTILEVLVKNKIMGDLPDSNQLSLF